MKQTEQVHQSLISLCKNNCAKSQMQLYKMYCNAMLLVAHRYVNDRFIAEDIMQEAFVKAFQNLTTYKNEVTFGSWLKRIVINQSIDHLKKNKLELVVLNEEVIRKFEEEDWRVESTVSLDRIIKTIASLKDKYRLVLTLYLLEGYDHQEISEILQITENTSRTQLLRGKKVLKEQLKNTSYAARY